MRVIVKRICLGVFAGVALASQSTAPVAQTKPDCPAYQNCTGWTCSGNRNYRRCDVYALRSTFYGGRFKWSCTKIRTDINSYKKQC